METGAMFVTKSNGERERFSFEKLRESLRLAGASDSLSEQISQHIKKEMVNGMTTADIYHHAFSVLHAKERRAAARYSLRRSLLELGPTGFPFERFVSEMLRRKGFSVLVDQMVRGKCVEHELDIVAWNDSKLIMTEAKYHHELAYKSDVKVVLYVKARFDDLKEGSYRFGERTSLDEGWLVTNTKFTEKAIAYGECAGGVRLIGWNYPRTGNLHDLVEETRLHPVTCLTTFSEKEKQSLMEKGIVLCESVRAEQEKLRALGFDEALIQIAIAESDALCPA